MGNASTHNKTGEGGGWISEDWLALILGLIIFALSLGSFKGVDILGWGAKTAVWLDPSKAISTVSSKYNAVEGEITKIDGGYKVVVGSTAHPMEEKHWIEWIELIADGKVYRQDLNPGDAPEATFKVKADKVEVRELCNLHGVWKAEA